MDAETTPSDSCPFCSAIRQGSMLETEGTAVALQDAFPLNPGHALVVPRAHVSNLFALSAPEQADVWRLVAVVRARLQREKAPDGFNVGLNVGAAAGQTVGHAHVHVIPRFSGDVDDPRGGVRWLVPSRAPYWRGGGR